MNINLKDVVKRDNEYVIGGQYDTGLSPDKAYIGTLPDLQNGDLIKGAKVPIERVGISNFRMPIKINRKDGTTNELECSIVGTVSLDGIKKGINMSRIIRSFYPHGQEAEFDIRKLKDVLIDYQNKLGSYEAHVLVTFQYRMWQESLRSTDADGNKNGGWQYYNVTLEGHIDRQGEFDLTMHFDFVYSSACPCSTELSLHAMDTRGEYAIPHSQRSVARISVKSEDIFWIEDMVEMCREALKTETVVFCKREDEQAFAELNAQNTKFVEDAVRLVYEQLIKREEITDFKVIASHNESLHSHDAIAVITKGVEGGFDEIVSVADLQTMIY